MIWILLIFTLFLTCYIEKYSKMRYDEKLHSFGLDNTELMRYLYWSIWNIFRMFSDKLLQPMADNRFFLWALSSNIGDWNMRSNYEPIRKNKFVRNSYFLTFGPSCFSYKHEIWCFNTLRYIKWRKRCIITVFYDMWKNWIDYNAFGRQKQCIYMYE